MDNKKKKKLIITESTKDFIEEELNEDLDKMDETELMRKINESKKAVAKINNNGEIEIKQSLNG